MITTALFFTVFPVALCLALAARPQFFAAPARLEALFSEGADRGRAALAGIMALIAVPVVLLSLAAGVSAGLAFAALASLCGALWGAHRLGGLLAAGLCLGAALVAGALGNTLAFNLVSLCAGIGGAQLLTLLLRGRSLVGFMGAFAALDCVIVFGGLASGAAENLPAAGSFSTWAASAPIFNRMTIGAQTLGSGDVAYAALVAAVLVRCAATTRERLVVAAVYALAQALAIGIVLSGLSPLGFPATLPGLAALGALGLVRFRARRAEADVELLPA